MSALLQRDCARPLGPAECSATTSIAGTVVEALPVSERLKTKAS
jgi:hypothetical protein